MTRDEVLSIVRENIVMVLPEVDATLLRPERSLSELGANSVDRAEIVVGAMAALRIKVPGSELAEAKNIGGLVDVLYRKLSG
ncbi:acyl carrier protein [Sorangium sp. So ce381]|uniref:acyl carrier protein n=1 Tax=Sorangium sp. So ce381 TaxID=3133307 RepID=UPI003F5B36BC